MGNNVQQSFRFGLRNIDIVQSILNSPNPKQSEPPSFHFNINIEQRFIVDKKILIVIIAIEILDKDYVLGSIKTACTFEIPDLENFLNDDKKTISLPEQLTIMLNSVSVSTTRGIMFSHFRGTHLHNAILPVMDPSNMQKD